MPITCHFCPATVPDVFAAIAAGWLPGFWDHAAGAESGTPVCGTCVRTRLVWSDVFHDFEPKDDPPEPTVVGS